MSTSTAPAADAALTPSEIVLLFGDRFASSAGMLDFKEEVVLGGATVDATELATTAVRAAVRAAVEAGSLTAELEPQKALFGLVKRLRVRLRPGAAPHAFPAGTLEAAVVERAPAFLRDVVAGFIGAESTDPAGRLLDQVRRGMVARGLLVEGEKKTLRVFTSVVYTVPESTRALAERVGPAAGEALLRRGGESAELWARMASEIGDGIGSMIPDRD